PATAVSVGPRWGLGELSSAENWDSAAMQALARDGGGASRRPEGAEGTKRPCARRPGLRDPARRFVGEARQRQPDQQRNGQARQRVEHKRPSELLRAEALFRDRRL